MATRSSLELMLYKMQQVEDQVKGDIDIPPPLPVRPVSRARLPRARTRRSPIYHSVVESKTTKIPEESYGVDHFLKRVSEVDTLENSNEKAEKGISDIQKCYRGYQVRRHYKDLRRGVVSLQSFVRGENARRHYQYRIELLKATLLVQKQTRNYFEDRQLKEQHENIGLNAEANGRIQVPYNILVDLQKCVLSTEAKIREKNEENITLKAQLKDIDMKRQQYEERMKFMEKKWQDQLNYIQKCLAASNKNQAPEEIRFRQFDSRQRHNQNCDTMITEIPNGSSKLIYCEDGNDVSEAGPEQVCHKLHFDEELRKLKLTFKAWKKDYKNMLREAQSAFKKLRNSKIQKHWWGRLSY
ncbi:hypothetical protein BUALT_Bualt08G0022700 [Buddleja alternifolia]|uniref:Uncharacterized protein n=1 Tax=Buddleja alternifolia TaxID=168488 RepID=A0AAV6X9L6_9LAMI|nr:hypothetical protein BUALT_Bualt08G0022700 [Buddleja alternifolia]